MFGFAEFEFEGFLFLKVEARARVSRSVCSQNARSRGKEEATFYYFFDIFGSIFCFIFLDFSEYIVSLFFRRSGINTWDAITCSELMGPRKQEYACA